MIRNVGLGNTISGTTDDTPLILIAASGPVLSRVIIVVGVTLSTGVNEAKERPGITARY